MTPDSDCRIKRLAIIGCGLMGGSVALALKRADCVEQVVGYSRNPASRELALKLGVIDTAAADLAQAVQGASVIVLATPVGALDATLQAIAPHLSSETLLTDVGSTKSDVVRHACAHLGAHSGHFVPAHPIAGKEHAGVAHADANLYQNRKVILTPLRQNTLGAMRRIESMWRNCGAELVCMSPAEHDLVFAAVSHLPHLLAFSYINALAKQPEVDQLLALAGPGFRDFTRIAGADPCMWRDVFAANRQAIQLQLSHFKAALQQFEAALNAGDSAALEAFVQTSRSLRAPWQLNAAIPKRDDLTQQ